MEAKIVLLFVLAFLATSLADVVVLLGGDNGGFIAPGSDVVETYSANCGLFQSKIPPLPKGRRNAAAAYLDGKIYLCGGYSGIAEVKACYALDLTVPEDQYEWKEVAHLINGRYKFELVTSGSKLYAVGGEGPFSAHDDIEIYDPTTDTWSVGPTLTGFRQGFCAVATDDHIYVAGGFDQTNRRRRVERLDLASGEWSRLEDLPDNKTSHGCSLYNGGFIAAGGWTGTAEDIGDIYPTNTVEFFDFKTETWTPMTNLRHRRSEMRISTIDNEASLVVFGGFQGSHLDTYEFYNATGSDDLLQGYWTYGDDRMFEPKSAIAIAVVPSGLINEC